MKKTLIMAALALALGASALAGSRANPFDEMYRQRAKQEFKTGMVQQNYIIIDEDSRPVPGAMLTYVNRDNRQFAYSADDKGRVHLEFTNPDFIQLISVHIDGLDYRVIGEDLSEDMSFKDINKGEVEYYVLQRHSANRAVYIYEAD